MEEKLLFGKALFVISFVLASNYLFKVSSLSTKIRYESCLILRLSMLTIFNIWRRSSVFIVNCEHISNFVFIVDFEQVNVSLVHIEKTRSGISWSLLYMLILVKKMQLTFRMTCCIDICLFIDFAR